MNYEKVQLDGVFYINEIYSQKHAHMLHKHKGVLELLYIARGAGRYIVENREYAVKEGDLVICNADVIHGEAPFQEHIMQTYCIALSNVLMNDLPLGQITENKQKSVLDLERFTKIIGTTMINIYELFASDKNNMVICRQLAIGVLMMVEKLLNEKKQQNKYSIEQKKEDLVRQITNYIDEHYREDITLEKMSQILHISISHISHLFKRETGLAPMQYVVHRRIGEAQSLLAETNMPIKDIEEKLGFGSSCHLTAMFRKYVGISPRQYRKHFVNGTDENK